MDRQLKVLIFVPYVTYSAVWNMQHFLSLLVKFHTGCLRKIYSDKKNSFTNSSTVWQNVWYSVRSEVLTDIANLHINFRCTKWYSLGDGLHSCGISTGESTWCILVMLEHGWWLVFHQRELSHTVAWALLSFLVQDIHQNCYESILSFPFLKTLTERKTERKC